MSQPISASTLAAIAVEVPQPIRSEARKPSLCVPRHVAVVPDDSPADPHGWIGALNDLIDVCLADGVQTLSVLAWNGQSADAESSARLQHLTDWVRTNAARLASRGVKLSSLGQPHAQSRELVAALRDASQAAANSESLHVHLAVNYDGRMELASAVQALARETISSGGDATRITIDELKRHLSSHALPPVDLLIRTGGRTQLSDFLLWQTAYAELLFLGAPWTEMRGQDFRQALADYARRRRTFGGLAS